MQRQHLEEDLGRVEEMGERPEENRDEDEEERKAKEDEEEQKELDKKKKKNKKKAIGSLKTPKSKKKKTIVKKCHNMVAYLVHANFVVVAIKGLSINIWEDEHHFVTLTM